MPDIEIDLLRTFVAIAESGSFTAAAGIVGRSQSAVSQKILRLEESVGSPVFVRTSRSLRLTPAGEQLLPVARQILGLNDSFIHSVRMPAVPATLRLGITDNLVPTQLTRLVSRFMTQHPGLVLELTTGLSHDLLRDHDQGRLDAVIARPRDDLPSAGSRIIWREPLLWLAAEDFSLAADEPVRLVTLPPPCGYRDSMTDALNHARRAWTIAGIAGSIGALQAMIAAGMGVSALGRSFLHDGLTALPGLPPLPATEVMVVGEQGEAGALVHALADFLAETLQGTMLSAAA